MGPSAPTKMSRSNSTNSKEKSFWERILEQKNKEKQRRPSQCLKRIELTDFEFCEEKIINPNVKAVKKKSCKSHNNKYAMKFLQINDKTKVDFYLKEFFIPHRLFHRNIVKTQGFGMKELPNQDTCQLYILFEYLPQSLEMKIKEKREKNEQFSNQEASDLIKQLISVFIYFQSKRIYHADLKPSNILLDLANTIKIADFGLSMDLSNEKSIIVTELQGTPKQWSPEFRKAFVENKANLSQNAFKAEAFSLGLILLEILTLKDANDLQEIVLKKRAQILQEIETQQSKGVANLIDDLTKIDPNERKNALGLCFSSRKEYSQFTSDNLEMIYNLKKADRENFKLINQIGKGFQSEVWEVEDKKTNKKQALKKIIIENSKHLGKAMEELIINATMNHENIVKIFCQDVEIISNKKRGDEYIIYAFTELLKKSLKDDLKERAKFKRQFKGDEIIEILFAIGKAMKFMWERNVSHSDIKPHNILIGMNEEIKLCDFGVSSQHLTSRTAINLIKGTYLYQAPEIQEAPQAKLEQNPFKADIFSLGLTLLQMLTLKEIDRNYDEECKLKEEYFFETETVKFIKDQQEEDIQELLGSMIKFNTKERLDQIAFYEKINKIYGKLLIKKESETYKKISALQKQAKINKNECCIDEVLKSYESILNLLELSKNDKQAIARIQMKSGKLCLIFGLFEKAKIMFNSALFSFFEFFVFHSAETANLLLNIANFEFMNSNYAETKKIYKEALRTFEKINNQKYQLKIIEIYTSLLAISLKLNKNNGNQNQLESAWKYLEKCVINTTKNEAKYYQFAGWLSKYEKKYIEASQFFLKALQKQVICFGNSHPQKGRLLEMMGETLFEMSKIEASKPFFENAFLIQKNIYSEKSFVLINCLKNLAIIERKNKEYENSIIKLNSALEIAKQAIINPVERSSIFNAIYEELDNNFYESNNLQFFQALLKKESIDELTKTRIQFNCGLLKMPK